MANDYTGNPIVLDDFAAAIDVGKSIWNDSVKPIKLNSIEWATPTNTAHTAVISDGKSNILFSEQCTVANQSVIKYFHGTWVRGITIAITGVGSGKIMITYI